jgi:hypothetical protein
LRVFSAGRGHFSPDRSSIVMVMARHARIGRAPSIATWAAAPLFGHLPVERAVDVRGGGGSPRAKGRRR